ncbi:PIN domain-containing protein [Elizabethkingia anophelis]|uniref:PIN domain-containing protein n=1 Tax=Elizabethkingia anophelis TaxID=1117645 RepID=UPI0021A45258|nr:DUF4935 domain-containing protein [Elizabethkingia anophelis]HAY3506403.1 DUF4935 domain-containing protein [Elizabethkingia anophelis]
MKNTFKENLKLSEDDTKYIFENAFFVLDTNILINFYRYSSNTKDSFLEILNQLKSRLFIPYQVGKEFFNNRLNEISDQKETYRSAIAIIEKLKSDFVNKNRNPFLSEEKLKSLDNIIEELNYNSERFEEIKKEDDILDDILNLYENSIGDELSDEFIQKACADGKRRYELKIPPGYKDDNKPDPVKKFGDYLLWLSIIKYAKDKNKPCIFITDDRKEDWWLLDKHDNIIMPRPELRKEFFKETGNLYYSYLPFNFLDKVKYYLKVNIEDSIIEEVKSNSNENLIDESNREIQKIINNELINFHSIPNKRIYLVEELIEDAVIKFVNDLEIRGYECVINRSREENRYYIICILPNIFDIDRIFDTHFNKLVKHYSINVIELISI